ncbi:hypothetical protein CHINAEXTREME_15895 [Halobiforma lacisalsi AJ5]|uniref:Uncharacterized protein n=1 Tax=Natronobacterium lacisalsi AJ5 TaxID=358396 RepID=A0A1P8LTP2_NATLA|nr:hypothetical protein CHINAEXTREME_15895 [Halobiforma lacisalsi AJ5]
MDGNRPQTVAGVDGRERPARVAARFGTEGGSCSDSSVFGEFGTVSFPNCIVSIGVRAVT